jgi:hypothetical protein
MAFFIPFMVISADWLATGEICNKRPIYWVYLVFSSRIELEYIKSLRN